MGREENLWRPYRIYCLLTIKLSYTQLFKWGHSNVYIDYTIEASLVFMPFRKLIICIIYQGTYSFDVNSQTVLFSDWETAIIVLPCQGFSICLQFTYYMYSVIRTKLTNTYNSSLWKFSILGLQRQDHNATCGLWSQDYTCRVFEVWTVSHLEKGQGHS